MQPRMKTPALTVPGARDAILAVVKGIETCGVPPVTLELVNVRAGQINGCSPCVDMHTRMLKKLGESETRIVMIAAWRETPYYTDAERAALGLAEAVTRLSDRTDAVPDEIWNEATRHFSETALSGLLLSIAVANLWNRLNVPTRQVTGDSSRSTCERAKK